MKFEVLYIMFAQELEEGSNGDMPHAAKVIETLKSSFGSLSTFRSEVEESRKIKQVSSLSQCRLDAFLVGSCGVLGVLF
jgi:hypothetical protein